MRQGHDRQGGVVAGPGETSTGKRRGKVPAVRAHGPPAERHAFLHAPPTSAPTPLQSPEPDAAETGPRSASGGSARPALARPTLRPLMVRARGAFTQSLEDEADFGTPFLLVPVLLVVGISIYFALPAEPAAHNLPLALGLGAVLSLAARARSRLLARLVLAGLLVLAGMALGQWHTMAKGTQMLGAEVTTHLTGRIVRMEHRPNGSVRYSLDVIATERPRLRHVPDRLRVTARAPAPGVHAGDGLKGVARLFPLSGPARPGGYDFAFHGYFAGHGANGFFYGPPEKVAVPPAGGLRRTLADSLQNARLWLGERVRSAAPGEAGTIAAALVNGDKSSIPEPVNEALRISGLAHILTISGLHMALVAGTVMLALRSAFALSGPLVAGHAVKKYAALAALVVIFIYLFLAGAGVATQRSFTMLAVMLAALLLDRRAISKRNLAIAALVIIALFPASVIGPSFHMSFAATLALIALYDIWNRGRAERARRHPVSGHPAGLAAIGSGAWRFFAALAATSIVAGAASGLYAAYHFQRVAVLGLVTNLAAMPIVSLVTMPTAILATLAIPFGVDGPLYAVMAASAGWILAIAQWVADRSPDGMVGAMTNVAMLWATAALVWFCMCRTWLRWGALAPALVATILIGQRDVPLAVISEDGRQMAIVGTNGTLSVNRNRPNAFIVEQWQQAYAARTVIMPVEVEDHLVSTALAGEGVASPVVGDNGDERPTEAARGGPGASDDLAISPMRCTERLCVATTWRGTHRYDLAILSAPLPDVLSDATTVKDDSDTLHGPAADHAGHRHRTSLCGRFDLIVLAYAPAEKPCTDGTMVLTAQDLALAGSAEIRPAPQRSDGPPTDPDTRDQPSAATIPQDEGSIAKAESRPVQSRTAEEAEEEMKAHNGDHAAPRLTVRHAVSTPLRPWHDARRWSRAARNLAPY